jgi:nitrile hydratase
MNGVHDYGYEATEPVFHAEWEARMYALNRAMAAWKIWNLDAWRHDIERLPAHEYLRMSYYEKWLAAMEQRVVAYQLLDAKQARTPKFTVAMAQRLDRGLPSSVDPAVPAQFAAGQAVRARNIQPQGHTRLPRYARGKLGKVMADRGVHTLPDTNAHYQGENRQHLYSVQFTARELWGEAANERDSVYLDLWECYLEAV